MRCDTHVGLRETDADGVQVEYLWPAGSYIESSGPSFTAEGGGGLLTMVPVRINANGKARTVEELGHCVCRAKGQE